MKVYITLVREFPDPDVPPTWCTPVVALSSAVLTEAGFSVKHHSVMEGISEDEMWNRFASDLHSIGGATLGPTKVPTNEFTPCGFNMRGDLWPTICANLVKRNICMYDKYKRTYERWNNTELSSIEDVVSQGSYIPVNLKDFAKFFDAEMFTEHEMYKTLIDPEKSHEYTEMATKTLTAICVLDHMYASLNKSEQ